MVICFIRGGVSRGRVGVRGGGTIGLASFRGGRRGPFVGRTVRNVRGRIIGGCGDGDNNSGETMMTLTSARAKRIFGASFVHRVRMSRRRFAGLCLSGFTTFFSLSRTTVQIFNCFVAYVGPGGSLVVFGEGGYLRCAGCGASGTICGKLTRLMGTRVVTQKPTSGL